MTYCAKLTGDDLSRYLNKVTRLARRVLPLVSFVAYAPRYGRQTTTIDTNDRY